jgi:hypothetical protein
MLSGVLRFNGEFGVIGGGYTLCLGFYGVGYTTY